jgi:hypothetical protein
MDGDLFVQAAREGLTVHTHRSSVLYDVTPVEAAKRCKRLRQGGRTPCGSRLPSTNVVM